MNKASRLIKRGLALILVLLFSIESFAAVVGDNDGAAFITKAEFDSMKNDFQDQLDRYNSSLDNKIDGAIASYLAGVRVGKITKMKLDPKCGYLFPLRMFYNNSLWNDPRSDYYNLSTPEIHAKDITFAQEMKYSDNSEDAATIAGTVMWSPDTMQSQNIAGYVPLPATDKTIPPTTTVNFFNTYMIVLNYDIKGKNGDLCLIEDKSATRKIGSTTFDVFDVKTKGIGKQVRYYETKITTNTKRNGGAKLDGAALWCGYAVCGANSMTKNATTQKWTINAGDWRSDRLYINGHHGGRSDADYLAWGEDQKFDTTVGDLQYYNGGYNTMGALISNLDLQNNVLDWADTSGNHSIYAGNVVVRADFNQYFGFRGSFVKGEDSNLYYADIHQRGQTYGSMYNYSPTARNYPLYQFKYVLYQPDFTAVEYNNTTKSKNVSAYRAHQLRYFDNNGDEHYLDEGMFLGKFDAECTVKFTLKFGAKSGTKNVKVYISKEPFSMTNLLTKTTQFRVVGETGTYNNWTTETNKEVSIEVPNIEKNESLYLLWVPENADDFVTLDSFSNYLMES